MLRISRTACKELKVSHCTLYRWCRESGDASTDEPEEAACTDLDTLIEERINEEEPLPEPDAQEPDEAEQESLGSSDTIATAMALLVIENTHLREVIKNLRDTISGLTDHRLL